MSRLNPLTVGLIATAMLATPVLAREHHSGMRHVARSAVVAAPAPQYEYGQDTYGQTYYPTPRVGAFATAPWDNAPAYYSAPYEPMY